MIIMAKKKQVNNKDPVKITIEPGAMDDNAKGQYETVDIFCNQMEKMGLGALFGKDGLKDLREYNDQKMKEYDPNYLAKKETERKKEVMDHKEEDLKEENPKEPINPEMVVPKTRRVLDLF